MKPLVALAVAVVALAVPFAATAQSPTASAVGQARAAGAVGERFDGFLGVVAADAGPQLRSQVATINIRRRALYAQLATSRGVSLQEVGITAACQLLGTVGVGEKFLLGDNVWRGRVAGQEMLVPDYCRLS